MQASLQGRLGKRLLWHLCCYSVLLMGLAFLFFQGWSFEKFGFAFLAIALATICLFAFVFWVARKIVRPVQAIHAAAERVMQGDLKARAAITTNDEIGALAERFNAMVAQLSHTQEKFSKAFHANPTTMSIVRQSDGVYLEVNESWLRSAGCRREEVIGRTVEDVVLWGNQTQREHMQTLLQQNGHISNYEICSRLQDGSLRYGILGAEFIEVGGERCLLSSVQDITDRVKAEQALRASEERFSKLFHASPCVMSLTRLSDHTHLDVNKNWLRKFKRTREEVIGRNGDELNLWRNSEERTRILATLLEQGRLRDEELMGQASDGEEHVGLVSAEIIEVNGEACVVYTTQDITERKRAEAALRISEERFAKAFHTGVTPRVIIRVKDRRVIEVNNAALIASNQARSEVVGLKPEQTGAFVEMPTRQRLWQNVLAEGSVCEEELTFQNGLVALTSGVLMELEGEACVLWEMHDISERKRAEAALQDREERLRLSLQAAGMGTWEFDAKTLRGVWSPEYEALFGLAPGEFDGLPESFYRMVHPDDRAAHRKAFEKGITDQPVYRSQFRIVLPNGEVRWHSSLGRMLYDEVGQPTRFIGVGMDITEQKHAEAALQESETRLRLSMQAAGLGTWDYDWVNRHVTMSPTLEAHYGFASGTFEGTAESFMRLVHPEDLAQMRQTFYGLNADQPQFSVEFRLLQPDGSQRWHYSSGCMLFDEKGRPKRLLGVGMDITERKQAEVALQSSRTQLRQLTARLQNAREKERAEIARNIHDELGQSMTGLKFLLKWLAGQLIPEQIEARAKVQEMLELISTTIVQIRRVATSLRPGILDDFGLVAALEWQAQEFSQRTGIACRLSAKPLEEEMRILATDRATALFRIFQEALTNVARHAQASRVDAQLRKEDNALVMVIRDDGRGVALETLMNVRSLGLLGMRERAEMFEGSFRIEAAVPRGTLVTVRMPLFAES